MLCSKLVNNSQKNQGLETGYLHFQLSLGPLKTAKIKLLPVLEYAVELGLISQIMHREGENIIPYTTIRKKR